MPGNNPSLDGWMSFRAITFSATSARISPPGTKNHLSPLRECICATHRPSRTKSTTSRSVNFNVFIALRSNSFPGHTIVRL
jgi:hypothetical protein